MKSILLCEGKSDAILVSYYLNNVKGWRFNRKKDKRKVDLPTRNEETEAVGWYVMNEDILAIWSVGGKDNFQYAIQQVLKFNRFADIGEEFRKIIILIDRDQSEEDANVIGKLSAYLEEADLINNEWTDKEYSTKTDGETIIVKLLPIIIPFNKSGALETFLLDAICEMGEEESHIVEKSKEYIAGFELRKYLNTQRLKVKGEMAVALATLFPQKTYTPMDDMLRSIKWEEYKAIQDGFRKLEEI